MFLKYSLFFSNRVSGGNSIFSLKYTMSRKRHHNLHIQHRNLAMKIVLRGKRQLPNHRRCHGNRQMGLQVNNENCLVWRKKFQCRENLCDHYVKGVMELAHIES